MFHNSMSKVHHKKIPHKGDKPGTSTTFRKYYWIWAEDGNRRIVWGAYSTREEAQRIGASKLNCPFEVVELPTKDEASASRMLRARLLNETGDTENSFSRFSHKQPDESNT